MTPAERRFHHLGTCQVCEKTHEPIVHSRKYGGNFCRDCFHVLVYPRDAEGIPRQPARMARRVQAILMKRDARRLAPYRVALDDLHVLIIAERRIVRSLERTRPTTTHLLGRKCA